MLSHTPVLQGGKAWLLSCQKPPGDSLQEGTQVPVGAPLPPWWLWGLALAHKHPLQRAEGRDANLAVLIIRGGAPRAAVLLPRLPLGGNFSPDFIETSFTTGWPGPCSLQTQIQDQLKCIPSCL